MGNNTKEGEHSLQAKHNSIYIYFEELTTHALVKHPAEAINIIQLINSYIFIENSNSYFRGRGGIKEIKPEKP